SPGQPSKAAARSAADDHSWSSARSGFHVPGYDAVAFPARRHVDPLLRRAEMDGYDEEHDRQQRDTGTGEPDPWDCRPTHCIPALFGSESADPQQIQRGGQKERQYDREEDPEHGL